MLFSAPSNGNSGDWPPAGLSTPARPSGRDTPRYASKTGPSRPIINWPVSSRPPSHDPIVEMALGDLRGDVHRVAHRGTIERPSSTLNQQAITTDSAMAIQVRCSDRLISCSTLRR